MAAPLCGTDVRDLAPRAFVVGSFAEIKKVPGRPALRPTFVRMAAGLRQVDLMKSRSTQRRPSAENLSKCYTSTCQKWGAYGLSLEGVKEVVISQQVVEGTAGPLYMYGGGMRAS